jgi:voltage-dependent calcium channel L type alpha-1D
MIDFVFLIIYTLEMVLKVIAQGFVMRPFSYLRDGWNILDFSVVCLGWLAISVEGADNISAIKVIRILRPLRTIN